FDVFAGKKSAQIREILISESAWEEMTCLFAPSLILIASIHGNNILHGMTTVRSLRISCAQAMNMILIFIQEMIWR
ncbi:hypothetical protein ACPQTT_14515, partial [Klebsiella pneumoniae]|uniref:hypothetical protein n=1 Tax=Klebsiella pneumoniae TaxID=573 RepID=UPI003B58DD41